MRSQDVDSFLEYLYTSFDELGMTCNKWHKADNPCLFITSPLPNLLRCYWMRVIGLEGSRARFEIVHWYKTSNDLPISDLKEAYEQFKSTMKQMMELVNQYTDCVKHTERKLYINRENNK